MLSIIRMVTKINDERLSLYAARAGAYLGGYFLPSARSNASFVTIQCPSLKPQYQ